MITKTEFINGLDKYTKKIQPSLESAGTTYTAGDNITIEGGTISAGMKLNAVSSTVNGSIWYEVDDE